MKLIFNFDGTDNGRSDAVQTNVLKFHNALKRDDQVSFYFPGPGDEDSSDDWWDRLIGTSLGIGSGEIRDSAIDALEAVYQDGDTIHVTGFSRGAAIARMFCHKITQAGHTVHFLGVWDTVAAFMPFGRAQQETLFGDLHVSPLVENVYHAVSKDENRTAFTPNLVNARDGVTEVWFKGNHADIGGGYEETGLSDITLKWMLDNASNHGLVFNDIRLNPNPSQAPHREEFPKRRKTRRIGVKRNDKWSEDEAVLFQRS